MGTVRLRISGTRTGLHRFVCIWHVLHSWQTPGSCAHFARKVRGATGGTRALLPRTGFDRLTALALLLVWRGRDLTQVAGPALGLIE